MAVRITNEPALTAKLMTVLTTTLAAGGTLLGAGTARADLGWEHTGTLRVSTVKQPLLKFKMYNHWTPQRHRLLLKYSVGGLPPGMSGQMPPFKMPPMPPMPPIKIPTFAPQPQPSSLASAFAPMFASGSLAPASGSLLLPGVLGREAAPGLAALLPALPMAMRGGPPGGSGALALIQRAADDRLISYESQTRRYVSEPRRALLQRLRFDPWKTLAPQLSREAPPTFTPEQRERLVAELRALVAPVQRRVQKIYFRPLTQMRTFQGIEGRGYRITQLNNVGGFGKGQGQWMRLSFEWWVAGAREGDEAVREFHQAARENLQGITFPTTSMWINEYLSLASYPAEPAWRSALRTFMPPADAPPGTLGATPLHLAVTVEMPPLQRATVGDVRFELALTRRDTDALSDTVFAAPSDYKQVKTEPYLKKLDPILNGSALNSLYDLAFSQMKR